MAESFDAAARALTLLQDATDDWGDNALYDLLSGKHRRLLVKRIAALAAEAHAAGVQAERARLSAAWRESWDCSRDPGHQVMDAALRDAPRVP